MKWAMMRYYDLSRRRITGSYINPDVDDCWRGWNACWNARSASELSESVQNQSYNEHSSDTMFKERTEPQADKPDNKCGYCNGNGEVYDRVALQYVAEAIYNEQPYFNKIYRGRNIANFIIKAPYEEAPDAYKTECLNLAFVAMQAIKENKDA